VAGDPPPPRLRRGSEQCEDQSKTTYTIITWMSSSVSVPFERDLGRAGEGGSAVCKSGRRFSCRVFRRGESVGRSVSNEGKSRPSSRKPERPGFEIKVKVKIEAKVKTRTLRTEGMRHPTLPMLRSFTLRNSSVLYSTRRRSKRLCCYAA